MRGDLRCLCFLIPPKQAMKQPILRGVEMVKVKSPGTYGLGSMTLRV